MNQTQPLSKEMIIAILDGIDEAIHAVDQNGYSIYYNRVAANYDGMKQEEVLGKHILSVFPSLTEQTSTLLKVLKTKKAIYHQKQRYENQNGQILETVNTTIPIMSGESLLGAVEIAKNYGQLKLLSHKLMDLQSKVYKTSTTNIEATFEIPYSLKDFITDDKECLQIITQSKLFAASSLPIVIFGETGTGKEIIAQGIHKESPRKLAPFIAQNCGAIPETLLESILFGTTKGSYTGATERAGLFEMANGGTLFLDEMNSMSKELQAKLLRVLEDGFIRRVGGTSSLRVDVRIITAMNESPEKCVEDGKLRSDLYYRLNTCSIHIPPLRNRPKDVSLLIHHFLTQQSQKNIQPEVEELLKSYTWPGNVRELLNTLEYLSLVSKDEAISFCHLPSKFQNTSVKKKDGRNSSLKSILQQTEEKLINEALVKTDGNVLQAAKLLDVPRQTLQYKLTKIKSAGK
ncbi:sigma-54 interaction domain-containing protein [Sutcliffiella rhizosphaerae]|uniref:Arginine utilization regulatory protein RocR n=1 Tax=Sutcliffiella rhizosphaerae TaxID=2880967 RepID=A0ABN8AD38_9BACI|nr:sigma 54-interacting transcriptional regulator [Sutcliffiella rhizosphaerae]CAG9621962.1 Arginine utilization regulatory protein RocR [Sutcliffiella rhizosphaerae]